VNGIVFFVSGQRGLRSLAALCGRGHGVSCAVVPRLRGEDRTIRETCRDLAVDVVVADDVNDQSFIDILQSRRPQLFVIGGFPIIFKRPLLDVPVLGTINLHGGRLPEYRGGSPLNWQIIEGEPEIGISIVRTDEGIDNGDVLAETTFPLGINDDIQTVHAAANEEFPRLLVDVVEAMDRGDLVGRAQDETVARYWHQRNEEDGRIDWCKDGALRIHNLVRAITYPYPAAYCRWGDKRVRIFRAELASMTICGVPGRVIWLQGRGPYVVCADRAILLTEYSVEEVAAALLPNGVHLR